MANPASPVESGGTKLGYGMWNDGGTPTAALFRILAASLINAEDNESGWLAVASHLIDAAVGATDPVVLAGLRAASSDPTAVANGDAAAAMADLLGRLVVAPYALPGNLVNGGTAAITDTTATSVIAAPGSAGLRTHVTEITISNDHATVDTMVQVKSATTVLRRVLAVHGAPPVVMTFPGGLRLGDNEALMAECDTTGASVYVAASGYTGR